MFGGFFHGRKPKTKRAKRFLEKREPKLTENTKNAMLIKGGNASLTVAEVLKNIVSMFRNFCKSNGTSLGLDPENIL